MAINVGEEDNILLQAYPTMTKHRNLWDLFLDNLGKYWATPESRRSVIAELFGLGVVSLSLYLAGHWRENECLRHKNTPMSHHSVESSTMKSACTKVELLVSAQFI